MLRAQSLIVFTIILVILIGLPRTLCWRYLGVILYYGTSKISSLVYTPTYNHPKTLTQILQYHSMDRGIRSHFYCI